MEPLADSFIGVMIPAGDHELVLNYIPEGLPLGILLFSFAVEFLQRWGFCDKMHITNHLLRILIGTGFSVKDLVSYCIGIVPCILCELFRHYTISKQK